MEPQLHAAILYLCAELTFFLVRSDDIKTVFKSRSQRTEFQQARMERGLARSLLLELAVFVPASATLVLLAAPILVPNFILAKKELLVASSAVLGIISYGFPFATIRRIVTESVTRKLKRHLELLPANPDEGEGEENNTMPDVTESPVERGLIEVETDTSPLKDTER